MTKIVKEVVESYYIRDEEMLDLLVNFKIT